MSRKREFKENSFSFGIPDVFTGIGLPAAGGAVGAFITKGLINGVTYITHFTADAETTKWCVVAGALAGAATNIGLVVRNKEGAINTALKSTVSAATFAGIAYLSFGTDLFNDKAQGEVIVARNPTIEEFITHHKPVFQDALQDMVIHTQPQPSRP